MTAEENRRVQRLASMRSLHRAFQWLHLHEPKIRAWQCEISSIAAPTFAEAARAEWMSAALCGFGLESQIDAAGNVVAWRGATQERDRCVLVSAHLDTVFPADTDCSVAEDAETGVLRGAGICDNAAGLAALLALAAATQAAEIDTAVPLLFCANVGEEGLGNLRGIRHLFDGHADVIRAAIVLEGAGTAVAIDRALGSRRLRVEVAGPGGHSWADAATPNPIFALADVLTVVSRFELPAHPRVTLQCGMVRGGTSVNSIPQSASTDIDLRCADATVLESVEGRLLAALRSVPLDPRLRRTIALLGERPAGALPDAAPLRAALAAVDRHLGLATELRVGSTDANLPLSRGVPALAVGAGGSCGGAHTLAEWYDPRGRELALRRVLLLAMAVAEQAAETAR